VDSDFRTDHTGARERQAEVGSFSLPLDPGPFPILSSTYLLCPSPRLTSCVQELQIDSTPTFYQGKSPSPSLRRSARSLPPVPTFSLPVLPLAPGWYTHPMVPSVDPLVRHFSEVFPYTPPKHRDLVLTRLHPRQQKRLTLFFILTGGEMHVCQGRDQGNAYSLFTSLGTELNGNREETNDERQKSTSRFPFPLRCISRFFPARLSCLVKLANCNNL